MIEDSEHPAARFRPAVWSFTDEWYDFRANPGTRVRILAVSDEPSMQAAGWNPTTRWRGVVIMDKDAVSARRSATLPTRTRTLTSSPVCVAGVLGRPTPSGNK
ncbi:hypothetical protein ACN6K4_007805 [Streptomyces hayashii]|uniref:hypothetical protein n=1 Tax=Streptomyces hayashii TaxID=2839966 RepID=UPI00403D03B2